MRRFYLFRKEDVHGMSGTGRVADGVEFDNGWVALTWKGEVASLTTFHSISAVQKLHTHNGQHDTQIIWVDELYENIEGKGKELKEKIKEELLHEDDNNEEPEKDKPK